jgi:hypothetical protein
MPGPNRRSRRLKQGASIDEIGGFLSVNPSDGDILVYDSVDGRYENSHDLTGAYTLAGSLLATDITVTNDLIIQDALTVQGTTSLGADLSVTGAGIFNTSVTVATTLGVTGATTLSDTLNVAGLLTGAGFLFSGSGTVQGSLTVQGAINLTGDLSLANLTATTLTTTGTATVGGNLLVSGVTVLNDDLTVNANISGQSVAGTSLNTGGSLTLGTALNGPAWNLTRTAPTITFATTTNNDTLRFTGNTDLGAGQITRTMLELDAAAAGGALLYAEGVLELSVLTGNVLVANALEIDGDLNHDGTNIGFYGVAPVARPAAYTQTFATADRTHAARTALTLTDSTGSTANQTVVAITAVGGSGATTTQEGEINDNFADLTDEINKLIADVADTAELLNSVIDDLQANGILQ